MSTEKVTAGVGGIAQADAPDPTELAETETAAELFKTTRWGVESLLDRIDFNLQPDNSKQYMCSESDPYTKLKDLCPPSTPLLVEMFGLKEYWKRKYWTDWETFYKEKGQCPASAALPEKEWKVVKGENGHMIVVMDRETLQILEDGWGTEKIG